MTKSIFKGRKKARIVVVDDHPIIRRGLADLINQEEDLEVCAEATDAHQALEMIASLKPDIALVDLGKRATRSGWTHPPLSVVRPGRPSSPPPPAEG